MIISNLLLPEGDTPFPKLSENPKTHYFVNIYDYKVPAAQLSI